MPFDLGEDLHVTKDTIGQQQLNKILTKLRRLGTKIENFAIKRWVTYSPLIDVHNTDVTAGVADEATDDYDESSAPLMYFRYPPEGGTVRAYDLVHTTMGTVPSDAFYHNTTKFGGGCQFDGAFNFKIDSHAWFNVTDKIAIGGWIRPKAFTGAEQVLVIKDQQYKMVINASANTIEASVYISGSWGNAVTYAYTPDTFIDIWMDWDGTTLELWVNNAMVDSEGRAGTLNTTSNNVGLAGTPAGGSRVADGTIMSWWTLVNESVANVSGWLAGHLAGVLDTEQALEITTMPLYMEGPLPDAYEGMFTG